MPPIVAKHLDHEIGTSIDESMGDDLRVTMVATGIVDGSAQSAAPRAVEVVQPVAKAVGSTYDPMSDIDVQEPSLISGTRGRGSDELPLFDAEGESKLDVPTFLRRQAD